MAVVSVGQVGFGGGFAQQTTFGPGNVEVFFPWPDGGFAQYWYERATGVWHGPVICVPVSHGRMSSVSWHEGDYQTHDGDHNNFELVAVESGRTVHYFRENAAPLRWSRGADRLGGGLTDATGAVLGRTHRNGDPPAHEDLEVYTTLAGGGIYREWRDAFTGSWAGRPHREFIRGHSTGIPEFFETRQITGLFSGVGWARGTVHTSEADFGDSYNGEHIVVAVGADGSFTAFDQEQPRQHIGTGVRGRPCVIQTDRGRRYPVFGPDDHGHYEAFAPARAGGIKHFWRPNPGNLAEEPSAWTEAAVVGSDLYDEVSVVQLRDEDTPDGDETAPLWLFARVDGQTWVDLFQQRHSRSGFRWERLATIGDPRRTDVVVDVPQDFVVVNPLKRGEVHVIDYVCYRGSPSVWLQATGPGAADPPVWVPYRGEALRAKVRESYLRRFGQEAPELDLYERGGTIDTPLMAAGTVVRIWATTDPAADPNRPDTDLAGERVIIATGSPGTLVSGEPGHAVPDTDRVRVALTADEGPVCLIAEIGTGAPREHRPYGHAYHAFDRPIGRIVDGHFRRDWAFALTRNGDAPYGGVLVPGGAYTVIVRAMSGSGRWTEVVAPVTLLQRQVEVTVDRVEIVESGDSGAAEGWFSAEVHSGRWIDGTAQRIQRWQFGDEDNWAELEDGDVFGSGGSVHPTGPPWRATIGPAPVTSRAFGVRLEIFDKDGLFEPDEHASGEWDTEDDRAVTDVPFEVRTDRAPPYATAAARGRYSVRYVSPPGQPERLDWRPLTIDWAPDLPVSHDYDGDGQLDSAIWRPPGGVWITELSVDASLRIDYLGAPGDLPAPGAYDYAVIRPAVFRPSDGTVHTLVGAETVIHTLDTAPPSWLPTLADSLRTLAVDLITADRTAEAAIASHWQAEVETAAYRIAAQWYARSAAAHPNDIPTQVNAARQALDIYLAFARLPYTPQAQLATIVGALDQLARLIVFGTPDSAPGVEVFATARAVYSRLTGGEHQVEIATSWTSQALTHHEIAVHPAQKHKAEELSRQRAAAAEGAAILLPIVDALDDHAPDPIAPERLLTVASDLDALARFLVFGSTDSTAGVAAATRARSIYQKLSSAIYWRAIARSFTNEALTHHEIGVHLPDPNRQSAELAAQRAAARQAVAVYIDAARAADTWQPADVRDVVVELRSLAAPDGLILFGLRDVDPDGSASREAARRAVELADALTGASSP